MTANATRMVKCWRPAALLAWMLFVFLSPTARGNSIATIVVAKNGDVLFSDYARDKIWRVGTDGRLSIALAHSHTFHLVQDKDGAIFGERRPSRGGDPSIWRLEPNGAAQEVLRASRWGRNASYRGTVFTIDTQGNLLYLRDCQLVRLTRSGGLETVAGRRCTDTAWTNPATIYGHLHGSLAWGPAGELYFSDGRSIRRVRPDGTVLTLSGRPTTLFADPQEGEERFDTLAGLAVDSHGDIFAADRARRTILRFGADGKPTVVANLGLFWSPTALTVSGDDVLVLVNLRFPTPAFLGGVFGNPTLRKLAAGGRMVTLATVSGR